MEEKNEAMETAAAAAEELNGIDGLADGYDGADDAADISFGGGADNEFIKSFAETPRYDRSLEEIELTEKTSPRSGLVDPEVRERVRAQALRRRAQETGEPPAAGRGNPDIGWRIGGETAAASVRRGANSGGPAFSAAGSLSSPEAPAEPQPFAEEPAALPDLHDTVLVQPLADEPYYGDDDAAAADYPKTGFQSMFSTRKGFGRTTLLLGLVAIFWDLNYLITVIARAVKFNQKELELLKQGVREYTLTYESPLITPLKFLMYAMPVLILIWALRFRRADKKNAYYNRRTVTALLVLIIFAVFLTVLDLTGQHLLV